MIPSLVSRKNNPQKPRQPKIQLFESLDEVWLHNWEKLTQTNKLKWLIKNEKDRNRYVRKDILDDCFLKLMDEWFKLTEVQSNRAELHTLMKKVIAARNKVMNGDQFQMNWVQRYEQMIKDLLKDNVGFDPDKQRMALSAELRMHIDKKKITVVDYYKLIEVVLERQPNTPEDGEEV